MSSPVRSASPLESRHPCPVCLGVKMTKVRLPLGGGAPVAGGAAAGGAAAGTTAAAAPGEELVLDHCDRCGGVWFELGEVQQLRRCDPSALWSAIVRREGVHSMQCHSCSAHVPRTASHCAACGWEVRLDCPTCDRKMDISQQSGLRLDYCRNCKGVWFDHDELASIWNLEAGALMQRRHGSAMSEGAEGVLGLLMYDPFAMYYGIHAAGYVAGSAANALSHAPEMISAAPEMVAEAAGAATEVAASLFSTIVEIIAGLFE